MGNWWKGLETSAPAGPGGAWVRNRENRVISGDAWVNWAETWVLVGCIFLVSGLFSAIGGFEVSFWRNLAAPELAGATEVGVELGGVTHSSRVESAVTEAAICLSVCMLDCDFILHYAGEEFGGAGG